MRFIVPRPRPKHRNVKYLFATKLSGAVSDLEDCLMPCINHDNKIYYGERKLFFESKRDAFGSTVFGV